MICRLRSFLASLVCAVLAACSAPGVVPSLAPPDMIDQLSNADLSANGGRPTRQQSPERSNVDGYAEKYPGTDTVAKPRQTSHGVTQGRNGFELNFNDAELSDLTKVILKDTLGIPFAYDPAVQGRVTLSTGGAVSREELLAILESTLAMNHGSLIVEGSLYRIVPMTEGNLKAVSSFDYARERESVGPGFGVTIMPLKFVSSTTMMRMLESVSARQDGLGVSVEKNLLIIRGTGRERESLLQLASTFDVDWMRGQSAGIYVLKNAAPDDVIKELQQVFQTEGQGKGLVLFQPIARLNAILVLTQKSKLLDEIESWVARLDRAGGEGEDFYVYRVENGRAKDLAALLMEAFTGSSGGGGGRQAEETQVAPTEIATTMSSQSRGSSSSGTSNSIGGEREGPASSDKRAGDNAIASAATSSLAADTMVISGGGGGQLRGAGVRVTPDERNNKLLIKASGSDLRKVLSILRRIDQPPLQVLINATLAEVTLNDNLKYGVQFFLQKNGGKGGGLGFTNGSQIEISPAAPGLNFIVGNIASNPRVVLDALATETAVRVVSSPSVVVLHNQTATLQVGDEVPITTRQATSVINPDSPVVNEIMFKNTGVILKVTPRINSNGLVTMEIEQEISAVTGATNSETLTPTISQRRISSTIAVQSGQMVVLGGLISEQVDREKKRVPVVSKIPYLGDLIGNTTNGRSRAELVVFLRPTVIHDPQDASNVTEAVRSGMQSMAPRAAAWDTGGDNRKLK
ncbi:type II secretion system secretin GspD [Hyphomicrobium sp.]|uniref:type II secretion system secretin GspD n=1 Tax=Hyphomicrobium sp. TaxID=82 RepID=UPI001D5EE2B6|nr:type II secretion system secretin GspD [Hyphomicrobium sp.]MBY0562348.1 type II secretion system secretin GspD [Hyphomicrobium sp.]